MFAASENGALPGGKVGGVGDVLHDLPLAMIDEGWQATVATPSYGAFHALDGAERLGSLDVRFRGDTHAVEVFEVPGNNEGVTNVVFEHPLFSPQGAGRVYCSDPPYEPFATDSSKFAFFSASFASWLGALSEPPDAVHLHDWHTGCFPMLREFDPAFAGLRDIRTVFTIHNLFYQGTRPFAANASSLESWFPGLRIDLSLTRDLQHPECVNPMAAALRMSDRVSTVSPTYAKEICLPSDHAHGFIGGEGLEEDLVRLTDAGKLVGILNGCEYPNRREPRPGWPAIVKMMRRQVDTWQQQGNHPDIHALAADRLAALDSQRPKHVMISIGRIVGQKVSLFLKALSDGRSALEHMLEDLGSDDVLILLGSGEPHLEQHLLEVARRSPNLIFLRGYSEQLADPLYRVGDLFLMPSSFEPCGISQMLAMRVGMPCVVHGVGGLRDTVQHNVTGFVFDGSDPFEQAMNFVSVVKRALSFKDRQPGQWQTMCEKAAAMRFDWGLAARQTIDELYDA